MTTFICPPQELPTEKVREIVLDAGCYWPEDGSFSSRMWRLDARRIVNEAWRRGYADHAAAQRAAEEAMSKTFGGGDVR